jgi:heme exporter protein C
MARLLLKLGTITTFALMLALALLRPAPQQQIGEASRIFYFHIPVAWLVVVAYSANLINAIKYLAGRNRYDDWRSAWSAQLCTMFAALATISGSLFAKVTWGVYWNWSEPRMLSIFILLIIYGAYLSLRGALSDPDRKATLSAVYALVAFPTVPFFVFVFPRISQSLHPADTVVDSSLKLQMGGEVLGTFLVSLLAFTLLYLWMFTLGNRLGRLRLSRGGED